MSHSIFAFITIPMRRRSTRRQIDKEKQQTWHNANFVWHHMSVDLQQPRRRPLAREVLTRRIQALVDKDAISQGWQHAACNMWVDVVRLDSGWNYHTARHHMRESPRLSSPVSALSLYVYGVSVLISSRHTTLGPQHPKQNQSFQDLFAWVSRVLWSSSPFPGRFDHLQPGAAPREDEAQCAQSYSCTGC